MNGHDYDHGDTDDKYIVFKREEFQQMMGYLALPPWRDHHTGELIGTNLDAAYFTTEIKEHCDLRELRDAVVIRRQDLFASPALAGYAAGIAIALHLIDDPKKRAELQRISDYFERQAQLAADEGWKTPDV